MPRHSTRRNRGRGVPRPNLSRDVVLRAAVALVDEDGASALTMRALGTRLEVEAMSLYHHVGSRQDLLDGMAEMLVTEVPAPAERAGWRAGARTFAAGIRQVALHHPYAFQLVGMRPLSPAAAARIVTPLLSILTAAGLDPVQCTAVYRLLAAFARGFSLAEIAGLTLADRESAASQQIPQLEGFATALADDHNRIFDEGLAVVVDGIAARYALP